MTMTDEYAAQYFHRMGWQSAQLGNLFNPMALREVIVQEIEEARKPFIDLQKDKQSKDYQFYNGVCNGMHFAKVIVENPK